MAYEEETNRSTNVFIFFYDHLCVVKNKLSQQYYTGNIYGIIYSKATSFHSYINNLNKISIK